jgi:hypothetical protein
MLILIPIELKLWSRKVKTDVSFTPTQCTYNPLYLSISCCAGVYAPLRAFISAADTPDTNTVAVMATPDIATMMRPSS